MPLEMKYFVLKPRSKIPGDPYAAASREALRSYSHSIRHENPDLSKSLSDWAITEGNRDKDSANKTNTADQIRRGS